MAASPSTPRPALLWMVAFSVRVYQWLLGACPRDFYQAYSKEMVQVFRQCCLDAYRQRGRRSVLRLWLPTLIDLLIGVIAEYRRMLALAYVRRNTVNRLRSTERTIFWSFIGFVLGYIGFLMMSCSWLIAGGAG
jgi:hypothetical protein